MNTRAFDTETGGLDWFEPDQQAFLTTWSDQRGNDHMAHQDDQRAMAAFESDMRASDVLVAHNLPFDVHQLRATSGIDLLTFGKRLVDTNLLARVVVPERRVGDEEGYNRGFSLEGLSQTYLPEADQKIDLAALAKEHGIKLKTTGGYRRLHEVAPAELEEYAMRDTRATIEVLPHLQARLTDKLRPTWELERDLQPHLIRAEAHGVAVDQAKVEPLRVQYEQIRDETFDRVERALGFAIEDSDDIDAPLPDLEHALLDHGVPLYRKVKSCDHGDAGCDCALTTNKFALQEFAADFPVIQDLMDFRQASKFLATYIGPMLGRDVVHPSFWQIGAWTGRMSCSRPNMQNLPVRGEGASELRAMYVPRPGHVLVVSDYDQIELRLLAYFLHSQAFKDKIERGDDVFAELAAHVATTLPVLGWQEFGTDPADFRKGRPGEKRRGDGKNTVYAVSYGAGGGRVSDMLGLPTGPPLSANAWTVQRGYQKAGDPSHALARQLIATIKSWLPGYEALAGRKGRIYDKLRRDGYVSTINGRKQIVGKGKEYVGLNALIQGSAADIFKQGIINVSEALAPLGGQPVLFVHDEIASEVPIEHAEEALRLQDEAMMAAWDLSPALSVSGTICHHDYSQGK